MFSQANMGDSCMESSSDKSLQETVHKAQREVREILKEVQAKDPDRKKMETQLREVQRNLEVLDIHLGKHQ